MAEAGTARYCVNCAAPLGAGMRFCPGCGKALGAATAPVATPAPRKRSVVPIVLLVGVGLLGLWVAASIVGDAAGGAQPTPPSPSAARVIDPRLLAGNPASYKGSNLIVQGEALNVEQHGDYTWVQVLARIPGKDYDTESVVVEVRPAASSLLKGECYGFYGVGAGTQKVTRTLTGAANDVPLLRGYQYYNSPPDKYGTCVAPAP